jgi:alpha-L-rhamnosidase
MPPTSGSNPDHKPIDWVKAYYDSIRGRISTSWKANGNSFALDVTIPANTTATVYLPSDNPDEIRESGQPLKVSKLARLEKSEAGRAVLAVPSGTYHFTSRF